MSTHLPSIDEPMFTPVARDAAANVLGGSAAASTLTFIGWDYIDGERMAAYATDPGEPDQPQ